MVNQKYKGGAVLVNIKIIQPKVSPTICFNLIVCTFILAMIVLGDGSLTSELTVLSLFMSAAATKVGEQILRICYLASIRVWLPAAFVVGITAISLVMMAMTLAIGLSAVSSFFIATVLLFGFGYFLSKEMPRPVSVGWSDPIITLVLATTVALLARVPIASTDTLFKTGVLPIWVDYYLHGVTIASFGSHFSTGGDMELVGVTRVFYHYASFMIPAMFQTVSGISGLALATSCLLPLGLLIAALGSYSFASELGGRAGGVLSIAAIVSVPAFSLLLQSGWFSFYWLLFIAPGSGYAIGASMVVCTSVATYLLKNDRRILWFTTAGLLSIVFVRVHMFMLLAPAIVILIALQVSRTKIRTFILTAMCIIVIGMVVLHFSKDLHSLWLSYASPHQYLDFALSQILINGYPVILSALPSSLATLAQIAIILAAILGIFVLLYPIALILNARRIGFNFIDAFPLILIATFVGLMLFAPSGDNGDFTEYKHRHFLLMYVVIAIYTTTMAFNLVSRELSDRYRVDQSAFGVAAIVLLVAIVFGWGSDPARPDLRSMPWARNYDNQIVTPGLVESARYLGIHALKGDVLAMDMQSIGSNLDAPIVELVSLAGIPAYIARPNLKALRSKCVQQIVAARLGILKELSDKQNWSDAQSFLRVNGIRWFVTTSENRPKWDPNSESAVFTSNGMSVYDVGHSVHEIYSRLRC